MATIRYFSEGSNYRLRTPTKSSNWIKKVVKKERATIVSLNYIFCSDSYLLKLNKAYLNHSTLTDIITFDYSEKAGPVNGEIYISIDRVRDNAKAFKTSLHLELHRVIIHGVLHLLGYRDKKPSEKVIMRKKEEAYLSLLK